MIPFSFFSIVDLKLLERLVKNVRSTLSMYDPSRGLTDLLKKLPSEFAFAVQPSREILPDPWQDVRHLQIRYFVGPLINGAVLKNYEFL